MNYKKKFLILITLLLFHFCSSPITTKVDTTLYPLDIKIFCSKNNDFTDNLTSCEKDGGSYFGLVFDSSTSELKMIDFTKKEYVDLFPEIPGYNGIFVNGTPDDFAIDYEDNSVFVLKNSDVARLYRYKKGDELKEYELLPQTFASIAVVEKSDSHSSLIALSSPEEKKVYLVSAEDPSKIENSIPLEHKPFKVVYSKKYDVLVWNHEDVKGIGVYDFSTQTAKLIPFGNTCEDGIDNNGDGRIDSSDPLCQHPYSDENSDSEVLNDYEPSECNDGIDNDGDGLTDFPDDPGCDGVNDSTENSDNLFCKNSKNNDSMICGTDLVTFPCSDGIDNDGDGLTDFPDDPDCSSVFDRTEDKIEKGINKIYLNKEKDLLFIISSKNEIYFFDLKKLEMVYPDSLTPYEKFMHFKTHVLNSPILSLVDDGDKTVFAATLNGKIYRIEYKNNKKFTFSIKEVEEPQDPSISRPSLYEKDTYIETGLIPPFQYPSFGPLEIEESPDGTKIESFYSIKLKGKRKDLLVDRWTVEYEGKIPHSFSNSGKLFMKEKTLFDPATDFCELGVIKNDIVVATFPETDTECKEYKGKEVRFKIDEVFKDKLILKSDDIKLYDHETGKSEEINFKNKCGNNGLFYKIVAGGVFLVRTSDFIFHNLTSINGRCETRKDSDPLYNARAPVSEPKDPDTILPSCPSYEHESMFDVYRFENPYFSFTLFPGCDRLSPTEYKVTMPTEGIKWVFSTTNGLQPDVIGIEGLPFSMDYINENDILVITELSQNILYAVKNKTEEVITIFY